MKKLYAVLAMALSMLPYSVQTVYATDAQPASVNLSQAEYEELLYRANRYEISRIGPDGKRTLLLTASEHSRLLDIEMQHDLLKQTSAFSSPEEIQSTVRPFSWRDLAVFFSGWLAAFLVKFAVKRSDKTKF